MVSLLMTVIPLLMTVIPLLIILSADTDLYFTVLSLLPIEQKEQFNLSQFNCFVQNTLVSKVRNDAQLLFKAIFKFFKSAAGVNE